MKIDLIFPAVFRAGSIIPLDHGYQLYSSVCGIIPEMHGSGLGFVHLLHGVNIQGKMIELTKKSNVIIRTDIDDAWKFRPLMSACLNVCGVQMLLEKPRPRRIEPSNRLYVPALTVRFSEKNMEGTLEEKFMRALRFRLGEECGINLLRKKYTEVNGVVLKGYDVFLDNVIDEESVRIQEEGLGTRRAMGCGIAVRPLSSGPVVRQRPPALAS